MVLDSPRHRRRERTRRAILDVAAKLIVKHGYDRLSLREVARQADYSPAALYEYFKSKEEILAALGEETSQKLTLGLMAVPENLRPVDRLVRMALLYVRYAISNREEFQLMSALPTRRKSLDEPVPPDSPYNVLLKTVEAAIAFGTIKPIKGYNADKISYSLWAFMHGMAMLQLTHLEGFQADFEKIDRLAIQTFLDGLH